MITVHIGSFQKTTTKLYGSLGVLHNRNSITNDKATLDDDVHDTELVIDENNSNLVMIDVVAQANLDGVRHLTSENGITRCVV